MPTTNKIGTKLLTYLLIVVKSVLIPLIKLSMKIDRHAEWFESK